jgi:5-deoxy-glucuronate isomerase
VPYSASDLLIRPTVPAGGELLRLDNTASHFEYLNFSIRAPKKGESFNGRTDQAELCIMMLGGTCSVESSASSWQHVGKRANVFAGMPYAVYLSINTEYTVYAETDCEIALCSSRAEQSHPAQLITPDNVELEVRGGGNATRQINHLIKHEFDAQRLSMVEVYTPSEK